MIRRICGKIIQRGETSILLEVNGFGYEVLVPQGILKCLRIENETAEFFTYHYYQTEPSKSIPVLIGFLNEIEKEFFEKFITVSGIGPKAAVKALSGPIPEIAAAIDSGDIAYLRSLPGIGRQRAREIVAKLQGKVGKFGLMRSVTPEEEARPGAESANIEEEAVCVLLQLQYKKSEAEEMVKKARRRNPAINNTEELLNEVYRQRLRQE